LSDGHGHNNEAKNGSYQLEHLSGELIPRTCNAMHLKF